MTASLRGPLSDLGIAETAISAMASTRNFLKFHKEWQDFLFRIDRAWEVAERSLRRSPGFQNWFRPYAQQRKKDPLLVFLFQARNAETHAIAPTVDKPLGLVVREKYGHPFRASKIASSLEDGTLTIDIETAPEDSLLTYEAVLLPSSPVLVRFQNRGRWYEVPTSHLGNELRSSHPVDVARAGLAFYSAFIREAEHRFGRRNAPP